MFILFVRASRRVFDSDWNSFEHELSSDLPTFHWPMSIEMQLCLTLPDSFLHNALTYGRTLFHILCYRFELILLSNIFTKAGVGALTFWNACILPCLICGESSYKAIFLLMPSIDNWLLPCVLANWKLSMLQVANKLQVRRKCNAKNISILWQSKSSRLIKMVYLSATFFTIYRLLQQNPTLEQKKTK